MSSLSIPELLYVLATLAVAALFKPLAMLRAPSLQHPWLGCVAVLPWLWSVGAAHPFGPVVQVSGACLLVLMFGWPLAVWTLVPIAMTGAWIAGETVGGAINGLAWFGLTPALFALLMGVAMRRWLPRHLMVYIMGRAFLATAMAVLASGVLQMLSLGVPRGLEVEDMIIGRGIIGLGEAMATGLLVATMVVCRPHWLATYADQQYLPRAGTR
jgi:uncharacterized membrane protein